MRTMYIKLYFQEPILGTSPANEEIYRDFIGSKSPDAETVEDEIAALGLEAVTEKGKTVFPKLEDGTPYFYDYQVKGFFKDTCGGLRKVPGSASSKLSAHKKVIDKLIFPTPRRIPIHFSGEMGECQRPLRASTPQGERVGLAISDMIPAGATCEFQIVLLDEKYEELVRDWLDYGRFSGMGQWRNSGMGRFLYEELNEKGQVIGGNYDID